MTVAVNIRWGRLADMPKCKACGRIAGYCDHSDLVFAGMVPAPNNSISDQNHDAGQYAPRCDAQNPFTKSVNPILKQGDTL